MLKHPNTKEKKKEEENNITPTLKARLDNLTKTISWALNNGGYESIMVDCIKTTQALISMKYNAKEIPEITLGDIVEINYGMQLPFEICGSYTHAIVCKIMEELIYVVPIVKGPNNGIARIDMKIKVTEDAVYSGKYNDGIVLIDRGSFINPKRVNRILGYVKRDFLYNVLGSLQNAFNFMEEMEEDSELPFYM